MINIDPGTVAIIGGLGFGTLLTLFLKSTTATNLEEALAAKAAAETELAVASADSQHNALLHDIVHGAMAFAENHAADVVTQYGSKFQYVLDKAAADPRIAPLGLPTDAITHAIETVFLGYFKDLQTADNGKTGVKPADVIGSLPGGN